MHTDRASTSLQAGTESGSIIVCFGAGFDGSLVENLRATLDHSDDFQSIGALTRLRAAASGALYKRQPGSVIVLSGGRTGGPDWMSEAEAMRDFLVQSPVFRIPDSDMVIETEAYDTAGNVRRVAVLLKANPSLSGRPVILIAGRRHMERALAYFRAFGFTVRPMLVREALGSFLNMFPVPDTVDAPETPEDRRWNLFFRLLRIIDPRGWLVERIIRRKRSHGRP